MPRVKNRKRTKRQTFTFVIQRWSRTSQGKIINSYFLNTYLFVYLFLVVLVVAHGHLLGACGLTLAVASWGHSLAVVCRLLLAVASLAVDLRLWGTGFSSCGPQL